MVLSLQCTALSNCNVSLCRYHIDIIKIQLPFRIGIVANNKRLAETAEGKRTNIYDDCGIQLLIYRRRNTGYMARNKAKILAKTLPDGR